MMTTDERNTLLEQAYDAEQRGDLKETERLRTLAKEAPQEPVATTPAPQPRQFRYNHWITPPRGR